MGARCSRPGIRVLQTLDQTRARACGNLLEVLRRRDAGGGKTGFRPVKAWVPLPILLPGEQTSTRDEPARSIYAAVPGVEAVEGVQEAVATGASREPQHDPGQQDQDRHHSDKYPVTGLPVVVRRPHRISVTISGVPAPDIVRALAGV